MIHINFNTIFILCYDIINDYATNPILYTVLNFTLLNKYNKRVMENSRNYRVWVFFFINFVRYSCLHVYNISI